MEGPRYNEGELIDDVLKETEGLGIERSYVEEAIRGEVGRGLESSIVKKDLKKVGEIARTVLSFPLAVPTYIRKTFDSSGGKAVFFLAMGVVEGGAYLGLDIALLSENPKLAKYVVGAQIATNAASGIYEYVRSVRERSNKD